MISNKTLIVLFNAMNQEPRTTYLPLATYTKLMRAAESVTGRVSRAMTARQLTISQFAVMEALLHKGPLCQREIAGKILKSTGNITLVIDNLEKRGLVRRERDNQDRRIMTVHLTPTGSSLIGSAFRQVEAAIVAEMDILTRSEQDTLGALCRKIGLQDTPHTGSQSCGPDTTGGRP